MTTRLLLVGIVQLTAMTLHVESSIFVTDNKMEKMIELNARRPHCRLHTDRGDIQSTMLNTDPLKVRQVPVETVKTLESVCFEGEQLSGEIQGKCFPCYHRETFRCRAQGKLQKSLRDFLLR